MYTDNMLQHEIVFHDKTLPVHIAYSTQENRFIPSHWHNHVEILFLEHGSMEIQTEDKMFTLRSGDIFIVNSGSIHQTQIRNKSTLLLLQIPYKMITNSLPTISSMFFKNYHPVSKNSIELVQILQKLKETYLDKEFGYIFRFNSLLQQLLYIMTKDHSCEKLINTISSKQRQKLQKIIKYMTENYSDPLTVSEVSEILGYNPDYFCRFFKRYMGCTFLEYLNLIRLTHIHNDLLQTDETVTVLQNRHGFTNYKVFSREFKKIYGVTPSKIRS